MLERLRFQAVAFLGSFLAFCLELAAAKLLLPRFGGSAYVWTGCVMFFQGVLLAGYLASRAGAARWGQRGYSRVHLLWLLVPFLCFPLRLPAPLSGAAPGLDLLWALAVSVGAPFFVLSMTVIVLQGWSARSTSRQPGAAPALFAASNAGAAAALVAYPLAIEPLLALPAQSTLWVALYSAYAALSVTCLPRGFAEEPAEAPAGPTPSARRRALWLFLSATPCAAMLAVSSQLALDFAAVPLLWIAPLAAYLATFVLNFMRPGGRPEPSGRDLPVLASAGLSLGLAAAVLALWLAPAAARAATLSHLFDVGRFVAMIAALFALAMIFHRSLAASRPEAEASMGEYYTWIAAGGWFGSALVGLAVPQLGRNVSLLALDWAAIAAIAAAAIALRDWEAIGKRPWAAAGLAGLCLVGGSAIARASRSPGTVYSLRNFYGVYTVKDQGGVRSLYHGNTDQGMQSLDPARGSEPLSYYHDASPFAEAWGVLGKGWRSIGVVGLGAGSIAAYGRKGQTIDFFELDPDVEAIAERWFSHLSRSRARVRVVTGDARLSLGRGDSLFDVLILDAFNSGSIPVHLLTAEAFAVYLRRLRPGGVLLLHVSNRYLDLGPMLAAMAGDLGLTGAATAAGRPEEFLRASRTGSTWTALSRDGASIRTLAGHEGWRLVDPRASRARPWTDQHASLLPAIAL